MTATRWRVEHGVVDAGGRTVAREVALVERTAPLGWIFDGQRVDEAGEVTVRVVASLDLTGGLPSSVVVRWRSPEAEMTAEHYLAQGRLVVVRGPEVEDVEVGPALLLPPLLAALGPLALALATVSPTRVPLYGVQLEDLALERLLTAERFLASAAPAPEQPGGAGALTWSLAGDRGERETMLVLDADGFVVAEKAGDAACSWGRSAPEDEDEDEDDLGPPS